MDYGKLKAMTSRLGVRPVEVHMGSHKEVLTDLPDFMAGLRTRSTTDTSTVTEAPKIFPADGGPPGPSFAETLFGSSTSAPTTAAPTTAGPTRDAPTNGTGIPPDPTPPRVETEFDLGSRHRDFFDFLRDHKVEGAFLGAGLAAMMFASPLAAAGAPVAAS